MGVYIHDMEMPTASVLFCIHPDGKVFADLEGGWREYKAIPVPKHGRLIDADALKAEGWELQMFRHDEYGCSITCRSLDSEDIPAIIPAEEGET